jgi:1-acyl-sn-glycerol-3-phosphate acyltransferase
MRKLRVFMQSVGAWGAFAVPTGAFGVAMPLVYPVLRRMRGEREAQRLIRHAVHRYCRMYFPMLHSIVPPTSTVFDPAEGVNARGRGTIYVANHSGTLDIVFLLAHIDDFIILGKQDLEQVPVFGAALKGMGTIFTERSNRFEAQEVFDILCNVIKEGQSILAFPQGHRLEDWKLKDLKRGIFRVALATVAPVVPVAIVNSRGFLRPHQFWFDITEPVTGWVVAQEPIHPRGHHRDPRAVSALRREVWLSIQEALERYGNRTL